MNIARGKNDSAGNAPEAFINHMLSIEAQETWARVGMSRPSNVKASVPNDVAESVPAADRLRKLDWDFYGANRTAIVDQWNRTVNR
jgi:ABC-type Fe3+ transport system substrate-binding protein